jgi:hypothetical protein
MLAGRRGTDGGLSEVSDGDLTGTGGGGGVTTFGRVVAGEEHDVPPEAVEGLDDAKLAAALASPFSAATATGSAASDPKAPSVFADSESAGLLEGGWCIADEKVDLVGMIGIDVAATTVPGKGVAADTYVEWMCGRSVVFGSGVVDRSEDDRELLIGSVGGGGETGTGRGFGIGGKSSLSASSERRPPEFAPLPS